MMTFEYWWIRQNVNDQIFLSTTFEASLTEKFIKTARDYATVIQKFKFNNIICLQKLS